MPEEARTATATVLVADLVDSTRLRSELGEDAEARWRKSISVAEKLGSKYELALTEQEAGRRLEEPSRHERGEELLRTMKVDGISALQQASAVHGHDHQDPCDRA